MARVFSQANFIRAIASTTQWRPFPVSSSTIRRPLTISPLRSNAQSFYIYDTWRPFRTLSLTGGLSYDRLEFPTNYRNAPIVSGEDSRDRLSPKAGVIWNPCGNLFVRGAYTQSLGGVSFDQSVGLEPNQVAGFNQVFRSIISESVVGSVAAPTYDTAGILIEDRFPTGTYVGLQAILMQSEVDRTVGTFDAFLTPPPPPVLPRSADRRVVHSAEVCVMRSRIFSSR